jgi:hypothetical protein
MLPGAGHYFKGEQLGVVRFIVKCLASPIYVIVYNGNV